ncbi:MAG: (d)CMP kinase, partial [Octadecabacter sp.]
DADVKMFVTASSEKRAKRRLDELNAKGMDLVFSDVLADVEARDKRDSERATAPLKPAVDAVLIDTTNMTADQAIAHAIMLIGSKRR